MPNLNPSPFSRLATGSVSGLMGFGTQTIGGAKTFSTSVTSPQIIGTSTTLANPAYAIPLGGYFSFYAADPTNGMNLRASGLSDFILAKGGSNFLVFDQGTGSIWTGADNAYDLGLDLGGGTTRYFRNGFFSTALRTPLVQPHAAAAVALVLKGNTADGASAVGVKSDTANAFTTAGSHIHDFLTGGTLKAYVANDGALRPGKIATGSLRAAAAGNEGEAAYDSTTKEWKVSNASAWNALVQSGMAQTITGAKRGAVTALTSSSNSIATDLSANNNFSHTFTENTTLAAPSNVVGGQSGIITFTQHASSPKTLAFNSFWKFPGGTPGTPVTATNSAIDALAYFVDPGGTFAICQMLNDVKT